MSQLDISQAFEQALTLMNESSQSVFITGKAGTGKSTLVEYFCKTSKEKVVVLAPTGVAALNVKGQTIHSFFNFYVDVTPEKIENKEVKPKKPKLYKKLKTILIDEVSMLRADLLDCIDVFLRLYGPVESEPFGGVKLIFVGDLYQLPPVVTSNERDIFKQVYETPYFFSALAFKEIEIEMIELDKVYRQKDQSFVNLLNHIRNNDIDSDTLAHLNSRYLPDFEPQKDEFYIHLTTTNQMADEINDAQLEKIDGKLLTTKAITEGKVDKEYYPTAKKLQFKLGAQIMMLNNDQKRRWVNGSIGIILDKKTDKEGEDFLLIGLQDTGATVAVYPFTWEVYQFSYEDDNIISKPVGTFTQFPFRLAWAVTIHKSQGKTFDRVVMDIGRGTFAAGQVYVGLSRCTSFEGVILKRQIKKQHIKTDQRIYKFLTGHQYKQAAKLLSNADKMAIIQRAIVDNKPLKIVYLKPNDTKTEQIINPIRVGIEQYNNKKFPGMLAKCEATEEERMFHVGRILSFNE